MPEPLALALRGASRTYGSGATAVHALRGVDLAVAPGSFTAVMGPSGSGKSTLLHCAVGLERLDEGSATVGGVKLSGLDADGLARLRRDRVGFVFQGYNLVGSLTARQNLELPLRLARRAVDPGWRDEVVAACGIGDRLDHLPQELSGGQQQRVAIARALLPRPAVVAADEPTGALDRRAGADVLALLAASVAQLGQTVVMVTHDPMAAAVAQRVVFMADGRLAGELEAPGADAISARISELARVA